MFEKAKACLDGFFEFGRNCLEGMTSGDRRAIFAMSAIALLGLFGFRSNEKDYD